jgi:hypothetical protein
MSGVNIVINAQVKTVSVALSTVASVIYQGAAKRNGVLISFSAANLTASPQTVTVLFNNGTDFAVWKDVSIPARQTVVFSDHPVTIKDSQSIKALAGAAASVDFIAVIAESMSQS